MALSLSAPPNAAIASKPQASRGAVLPELRGAARSLATILATTSHYGVSAPPGVDAATAASAERKISDE